MFVSQNLSKIVSLELKIERVDVLNLGAPWCSSGAHQVHVCQLSIVNLYTFRMEDIDKVIEIVLDQLLKSCSSGKEG